MTANNPAPVPTPGSDAAHKIGCTCSMGGNCYGNGCGVAYDSAGREMSRAYYIARNCPVHDPPPDLHLRPRQPGDADG